MRLPEKFYNQFLLTFKFCKSVDHFDFMGRIGPIWKVMADLLTLTLLSQNDRISNTYSGAILTHEEFQGQSGPFKLE